MARRVGREMTVEEFDAWVAAHGRTDAVAERADEPGGSRLSLVPMPDQHDACRGQPEHDIRAPMSTEGPWPQNKTTLQAAT